MFIESLEGATFNSPLNGRRFLLKSNVDLLALQKSNLSGAYINLAKGVDSLDQNHENLSSATDVTRVCESIQDAKCRVEELFDAVNSNGGETLELASNIVTHIADCMEVNPTLVLGLTRLKTKDDATFLHSIAVSALMLHFARHLKFDPETIHTLGIAGLLHDIGKTLMPAEILTKPGVLNDCEMAMMREHPSKGAELLSREPAMSDVVLDVCRHHHERPDGKGYPHGLSGSSVTSYARIAAICDVYDAVTSKRPYKTAWKPAEAARWMMGRVGQFDEALLDRFWISLAL